MRLVNDLTRSPQSVHPALLPKFGGHGMYGNNVHRAVLAAGERESGATIHLVEGEYDTGRILRQAFAVLMKDAKRNLRTGITFVRKSLGPGDIIRGSCRRA